MVVCHVSCWPQGAESEACPCFTESLKARRPVRVAVQSTIADGEMCGGRGRGRGRGGERWSC